MCPQGQATKSGVQARHKQEGPPRAPPRRRDDLHIDRLDGEAVLYDPRYASVHCLNAVTLLIWDNCDGLCSANEIALVLSDCYAINRRAALAHVERVVAELAELDLLDNESLTGGGVDPPSDEAAPLQNAEADSEGAITTGGCPPHRPPVDRGRVTRREAVRGGVIRLAFAAPVISTFFATPAYAAASNPIHPGSPLGPGGCKNVGFSCAANPDCCGSGLELAKCENGACCVPKNKTGCSLDEDCCDFPADTCNGGICN
jgi:hypothetical protein